MKREHAYKLREMLHKASASLPDEDALEGIELFSAWAADTDYATDQRLQHEGALYRVRQSHRSQAIYPPGSTGTEALYARVERPEQGDSPETRFPTRANTTPRKAPPTSAPAARASRSITL